MFQTQGALPGGIQIHWKKWMYHKEKNQDLIKFVKMRPTQEVSMQMAIIKPAG
jgi:hypothetical protein